MFSRGPTSAELATVLAAAAGIAYVLKHLLEPRKLPLPPGPRRLPLIGNLLSLPCSKEHIAFAEMSKDFNSDIVSLSVPGQTIIILNSAKVAYELLDKRSAIYSGRPNIPVLMDEDLLDWGRSVLLNSYNDRWRRDRRILHESLHKGVVSQYYSGQEQQIHALAKRLVDAPSTLKNFVDEVAFALGTVIVQATYGYTPQSIDDKWLSGVREAAEHVDKASLPTRFAVNLIPALKRVPAWLPGGGWRSVVNEWRRHKEYITSAPYAWTKEQIRNGTARPSIVHNLLSTFPAYTPDDEDDLHIRLMSSTLFGGEFYANINHVIEKLTYFIAASHTSIAYTQFFLLAMVVYPEVAAKIQAELDSVLGDAERMPTMKDYDDLPYVRNTVFELLRWQPVLPLAVPHNAMEDDTFQGYYIPKGSIILGNTWALSRDESVYPDPERFDPDRFCDQAVPSSTAFGFGRRACPGNHFAEASLFLMISSLMYIFDVRHAVDKDGVVIPVEAKVDSDSQLSCKPVPFEFSMRPRSDAHERLVIENEG